MMGNLVYNESRSEINVYQQHVPSNDQTLSNDAFVSARVFYIHGDGGRIGHIP